MKNKHSILDSFTALLICSILPGCGCGAVQTTAYLETTSLEESVPVSEPEEELSSVPETTEAEEIASSQSQPIETEETVTLEETVPIEESEITEMDAVMYATAAVNIRKEPSTDAEKIGSLSFGEEVQVTGLDENEQWYRVEYPEVGTGYVSGAYLSSTKPVKQEATQSTPSEAPVETPSEQPSEAPSEAPSEQPSQTTPPTAPNAGAQAVYDWAQQSTWDGSDGLLIAPSAPAGGNEALFGQAQDGSNLGVEGTGAGGILHAAD